MLSNRAREVKASVEALVARAPLFHNRPPERLNARQRPRNDNTCVSEGRRGTLGHVTTDPPPVEDLVRQVLAGPLERTSRDALHPLAHLFGNQLLSPQKPSAPRLNDRKATSERGQKTSGGGGGGNVRRRIRSQRPTASRPGPFQSPSRPATRPAGIRKKKRTNGGAI